MGFSNFLKKFQILKTLDYTGSLRETTILKIEILGIIKYKISISTKIQEILPENLKN